MNVTRFPLRAARAQLAEQLLDLGVGVAARDLFLQDQIRAHAPGGEVPHAALVFGPVRVAVEVTHALPTARPRAASRGRTPPSDPRAETEVLIVAARLLVVEVDVKELPRIERLGDAVGEIEPRHRIVRDLRIDPDHLRMVERLDEGERVADGGR